MFELNGKPVDLDFLQEKAKEYNMDFDSYIKKMESKGLTKVGPGKITPPKEESQGVPVEVNATPEIQPTFGTLDLDSNLRFFADVGFCAPSKATVFSYACSARIRQVPHLMNGTSESRGAGFAFFGIASSMPGGN